MKKIIIEMEDGIYKKLYGHMAIKKSMGNLYGIADDFVALFLNAIEKNEKKITIVPKETIKKE